MQGPGAQGDVHQPWLGHSSHGWGGRGAAGFHLQSPQAIWDSSDLPEHFINPILYSMQNVAWGEVIRPGLCSSHPLLFLLQIRLLRGILFFFFSSLEFLPNSKTSGTAHGAGEDCNAESGNRVMETEAPCWINAREQHLGRLEVKASPLPSQRKRVGKILVRPWETFVCTTKPLPASRSCSWGLCLGDVSGPIVPSAHRYPLSLHMDVALCCLGLPAPTFSPMWQTGRRSRKKSGF